MSKRVETRMAEHLAGAFQEKLARVLEAEGFQETLSIPEPRVTEFQRDSDIVSLQIGHPRSHQQQVVVESQSVEVDLLVGQAAVEVLAEVCEQLLGSLPWVKVATARQEIRSFVSSVALPRG